MTAARRFLKKGWVNTLMASVKTGSASRGHYATANAAKPANAGGDRELYISAVPAGSAQDNLRDLNRVGYRSARPWNEGPRPAFADDAQAAPVAPVAPRAPAAPRARPARKRKESLFERAALEARRDRKGVIACVAMCFAILLMTALWGGRMVDGVAIARDIAAYQSQTRALQEDSESLIRELETASSGERIRNLAQNELGMLRPERANQQTIYVRANDNRVTEAPQAADEPKMELLDILLGLLDVFHIGE